MIQSSPILQDGQVTNCRNTILQRFSYRRESFAEPHIRPPGVLYWEDESLEDLALRACGS